MRFDTQGDRRICADLSHKQGQVRLHFHSVRVARVEVIHGLAVVSIRTIWALPKVKKRDSCSHQRCRHDLSFHFTAFPRPQRAVRVWVRHHATQAKALSRFRLSHAAGGGHAAASDAVCTQDGRRTRGTPAESAHDRGKDVTRGRHRVRYRGRASARNTWAAHDRRSHWGAHRQGHRVQVHPVCRGHFLGSHF